MQPTYSPRELAEEMLITTRKRPVFSSMVPAIRQLAVDALTAKSTMQDGDELYVSIVDEEDHKWHVHHYGCRDVLTAMFNMHGNPTLWKAKSAESLRTTIIDAEMVSRGFTYEDFQVEKCIRGESRRPVTYSPDRVKVQTVYLQDVYTGLRGAMKELYEVWATDLNKKNHPLYAGLLEEALHQFRPAVTFKRIVTSTTLFGFVMTMDNLVYKVTYNQIGRYRMQRVSAMPPVIEAPERVKTKTIAMNRVAVYKRLMEAVKVLKVNQRVMFNKPTYVAEKRRLIGKDGWKLAWRNDGTPLGNVDLVRQRKAIVKIAEPKKFRK